MTNNNPNEMTVDELNENNTLNDIINIINKAKSPQKAASAAGVYLLAVIFLGVKEEAREKALEAMKLDVVKTAINLKNEFEKQNEKRKTENAK